MTDKQFGRVRRHISADPFVRFVRETAQNDGLSLQEKGMLLVLLSLPPDWEYRHQHLQSLSTNGETAHRSALNSLEEKGYVRRERMRREDGTWGPYDYHVFDKPIAKDYAQAEAQFQEAVEKRMEDGESASDAVLNQTRLSSPENRAAYIEREQRETQPQRARDDETEDSDRLRPEWAKGLEVPGIEEGNIMLDPSMLMAEYARKPEFRSVHSDDEKQLEAVWMCQHFPAVLLRRAIEDTVHITRSLRWRYLRVHLAVYCYEAKGLSVIGVEEFRTQYREAIGKSWALAQVNRLAWVILNHTRNQVLQALGSTHDKADHPGWNYFKSALRGIAESEVGADHYAQHGGFYEE